MINKKIFMGTERSNNPVYKLAAELFASGKYTPQEAIKEAEHFYEEVGNHAISKPGWQNVKRLRKTA